jgi:hypothetical protein
LQGYKGERSAQAHESQSTSVEEKGRKGDENYVIFPTSPHSFAIFQSSNLALIFLQTSLGIEANLSKKPVVPFQ